MKNKLTASVVVVLLVVGLIQVTLDFAPAVSSVPGVGHREVWQVVNVTNTLPYNTAVDVNVTANPWAGVYVACSSNVTEYFVNYSSGNNWQSKGYNTYWEWLNGTPSYVYHWDWMDWFVSSGSLTPITWSEIQFWYDMYKDSLAGASYTTFMGNTYMADCNLTSPNDHPDIISPQASWQMNQIKMISSLFVPASSTVNIVFKIVITQPGAYTFNITTTPGVTVSPSGWMSGGVSTVLVPYDYSTIQGAVNNASAGDSILVYPETYKENVVVNKTVAIRATGGTGVTALDGNNAGCGFNVTANNVIIDGFNITNAWYGVFLNGVSGVTVRYNLVHECRYNSGTQGVGITLWGSNNYTTIQGNTIYENDRQGILIGTGNSADVSVRNVITRNTIYDNGKSGNAVIGIQLWNANDNEISYNTICNHTSSASIDRIGIYVDGSSLRNVIRGNVIYRNNYGIEIYGNPIVNNDTSILENYIFNNSLGVRIDNGNGTILRNNNIYNNTYEGWPFSIHYGVSAAVSTDARYNWWGNETGPRLNFPLNPTSLGDNITDNVLFEPWLVKPYPPLAPISVVYVDPSLVTLTTPALNTLFTVNVTIANVTMLYGFQFRLEWNNTLLSLTMVNVQMPAIWAGNYYSNTTQTLGNYSLYASASAPALPFSGTTTVASLTFRSTYDPLYPKNVNCSLALQNVTIADPDAKPILKLVYSGNYTCLSSKPKILFMSSPYTAKQVPTEFDAYVNVTNVINLYAFNFTFMFNASLLNVLSVTVPYPILFVGWLNDTVFVNATGITPPANGTLMLARVRFKVAQGFVWNTNVTSVSCGLNFTTCSLYTQQGAPIVNDPVNGTYIYTPVPGDVSTNGLVDIVDLLMVAGVFGTIPITPSDQSKDLNQDGIIDILDIILVAHNYWRSQP